MALASASPAIFSPIHETMTMLQILPIAGLPEIKPGDDLVAIIAAHVSGLEPGDIVVVTQKIVSKAEGQFVDLASLTVSAEATELAAETRKDPQLVQLVLQESQNIVRKAPNVLITRHRTGHVMANAGIDASNIGAGNGGQALLLPKDPDASAQHIANGLAQLLGVCPGVIISDSFGRPWRNGTVNVAIGIAGMAAVIDQRGQPDRDGRPMQVTQIAVADAMAAAAGLAMGEGAEGLPVVILRGWPDLGDPQTSRAILRPVDEDLFR
jgi:coenzyme F420-0:L-glutamate ligase/coenzyme F420-1:gamma-L-glutamate ligase